MSGWWHGFGRRASRWWSRAFPASGATSLGAPQDAPKRNRHAAAPDSAARRGAAYPGDYRGPLRLSYAPHPDEIADPGEVVWTWVPYEEDHSQGKDRPVLIIARDGAWLLALPLSSKNHELDREQEASEGRFWMTLGPGPWDRGGRGSSVRLNRVVRVDPAAVRRIGGRLDEARFRAVAAAVRAG